MGLRLRAHVLGLLACSHAARGLDLVWLWQVVYACYLAPSGKALSPVTACIQHILPRFLVDILYVQEAATLVNVLDWAMALRCVPKMFVNVSPLGLGHAIIYALQSAVGREELKTPHITFHALRNKLA